MKPNLTQLSAARPDEAVIEAETERLLSGRTRDIVLTGDMLRLYQETSWPQRSKIVRAWAIWVTLINLAFIPISFLLIPQVFALSVAIGIFLFPAAHAGLYRIWSKPRPAWVEGLSVVAIIALFVGTFGSLGAAAHGANAERFLTGAMFFATIAVVLLDVGLIWSAAMPVCAVVIFFAFEMANPAIESRTAIGSTLYYAMGMFAVAAARRTAVILNHKGFLMSLRDKYRRKALTKANGLLATLATRDPLTGLANRRFAADSIAAIWEDPTIDRTRVAFIMADIDSFKSLNDTAGHAAGDDCIFRIARCIEAASRAGDLICRYGGEEFLIVLTDATQDTAWSFAERIRRDVEALAVIKPGRGDGSRITISLGIAFADAGSTPDLVTKRADDALYDAKRAGRNRAFMTVPGSPGFMGPAVNPATSDMPSA